MGKTNAKKPVTNNEYIDFVPVLGVGYRHDYRRMFSDIANGLVDEFKTWRYLIAYDMWFLLYFVLQIPNTNNKFVVDYCNEIQDGPKSFTLDMAAREHFKSSTITKAETIQYTLLNPNKCTAIFCYNKEAANDLVFSIKETLEQNKILIKHFPDVLYENPQLESPKWSQLAGLVVKRKTCRPEPTIAGYGLIDGMPIRVHFDRRIYDDIMKVEFKENIDMMNKVWERLEFSMSLGKDGGTHRICGTPYHYQDPIMRTKEKLTIDGKKAYYTRFKPATHDGTINGKPVLLSQEYLNSLKSLTTFNSQYLLDPSPREMKKLVRSRINIISPELLPERLFKFMIIDPSGKEGTGDPWAFIVVGVDPDLTDIRASRLYIIDCVIDKFGLNEAVRMAVDMYSRNGKILVLGVEEVAQSTTEVHISEALYRERRVNISTQDRTIRIFKPCKRSKNGRIENIAWTIDNDRLFISKHIPSRYIDTFLDEVDGFPYSEDNHGIDTLSYFILDLLPEYEFPRDYGSVQIAQEIPMEAFF